MIEVREARLPGDEAMLGGLWVEYLRWANDEMAARYGFRIHQPEAAVAQDLARIDKFLPPSGQLLVAVDDAGSVFGVGCLQRLGPAMAEIKRMYVSPSRRGGGAGRALLTELIRRAAAGGYRTVRLDSPDFMTAAHGLYRSLGFAEVEPYPESEIPDAYKPHALFMELVLQPESAT